MAIVTGACRERRVGAAIARALARAGCDLVITHRGDGSAGGDALARELAGWGAACRVERVDLDDPPAAESWAQRLSDSMPRLDILVHNASRYEPTPLGEISAHEAERHFRINALSPLLVSRACAPRLSASALAGGGAMVAMCDLHALGETGRPRRGFAAYSMSKAALAELVLVLARELAPRVRVNGVAPGVVAFPEQGHESDAPSQARYLARVPMARSGTPEEAAEVVRWLALDAAYCTGQIVRVDGGRGLA